MQITLTAKELHTIIINNQKTKHGGPDYSLKDVEEIILRIEAQRQAEVDNNNQDFGDLNLFEP